MCKVHFFLVILLIAALCNSSYADRRYFARSYLAYTLPMGAFEFELWNTTKIGKGSGYYYQYQPRFEFEYGVTDRLSASLYLNFNQITAENNSFDSKNFTFSSTSLELRYRLTNPDEIFIDPAIYFEFAYGGDEIEYEAKAIFSKRLGDFISAINFNGEIEREVIESKSESVFEVTAGLMYEFNQNVALGLEFRNQRGYEGVYEKEESHATFFGPTINIQTKSFYLTFNFLAQVAGNPSADGNLELSHNEKYEIRTILGVEL